MAEATMVCIAAYLVGSIPSGYLLVRAFRGVDVRDYGSRNVGAINTLRVGGRWLGIAALIADVGKAFAVVLVTGLLRFPPWMGCRAAFSVIAGHACSAWFLLTERRLSEGKSVACLLGVLVGLACLGLWPWYVAALPPTLWIVGLVAPRLLTGRWWRISPVTMAAVVSAPVTVWLSGVRGAPLALSIAMALLILVRHKNNIARLWKGTEPRLGERHSAAAAQRPSGVNEQVPDPGPSADGSELHES